MSFRRFFGLAGATVLAAGLSSSASAQSMQAPGKVIPAPQAPTKSYPAPAPAPQAPAKAAPQA
jgi:hypothetical protein